MLSEQSYIDKIKIVFLKKQRIEFAGILTLILFQAIVETIATYLILPFAYALMDPETVMDNEMVRRLCDLCGIQSATEIIALLSFGVALVYILKCVIGVAVAKIRGKYLTSWRSDVSDRLFRNIAMQEYSFFVRNNSAGLQKLLVEDVSRLNNLIVAILDTVYQLFTFVLLIIVLFVVNPAMTIFAMALVVALMIFVNRPYSRKITKAGNENEEEHTELLKWVQQFTGGIKNIFVSRKQDVFAEEFYTHASKYASVNADYLTLRNIPSMLVQGLCLAGIYVYIGIQANIGENVTAMLPTLAVFALAAMRLVPFAGGINGAINVMKFNQPGLELVYEQLCMTVETEEISIEDDTKNERIDKLKEGITIKDMWFKFEDSEEYLFQDISLKIPANKSVALIGTTGSGKTTLVDIILGLQKAEKGAIYADGQNIYERRRWWSEQIGYIPQFVYLCDDTISANVAFGVKKELIDEERVWECIKKAQLEELILSMPAGLHTITGENGIRLSGGQKQRIGIARALYNDPPLLIMDEATSALDEATEQAIMNTINSLSHEKTMIIIAHRLSTIEECDLVYRIEGGKVTVEKNRCN